MDTNNGLLDLLFAWMTVFGLMGGNSPIAQDISVQNIPVQNISAQNILAQRSKKTLHRELQMVDTKGEGQSPVMQNQQPRKTDLQTGLITLRGKLFFTEIPPTRSIAAYTGAEFSLEVDSAYPQQSNKLVLLPSQSISREILQGFHNQTVEIQAQYNPGTRPDVNIVACPIDINGECLPQGQGYEVWEIKPVSR